jgi:hypothetical protein
VGLLAFHTRFTLFFIMANLNENTPATCGAAKLVPIPKDTSIPVSMALTLSVMMALVPSPPGAENWVP